jgi:hypothetical protein
MNPNDPQREYNLNFGLNPSKIDEVTSTLVYVGYSFTSGADSSLAVWKIKKIEQTGTVWEIKYADGDEQYDNIWDNRAILNYK